MLITKTGPVGIDFYIQQAQTRLYDILTASWPDTIVYNAYGRCYRNKKDDGYIAEVYTSQNNYKEVYWDDTLDAISFFGSGEVTRNGSMDEADIHLVFFVNLTKLKPSIAHRADEEVRRDVFNALGVNSFGLAFTGYQLSIENVLREYPGTIRDERLKAVDMHPVHCFRFNYTLSYNPNKNC